MSGFVDGIGAAARFYGPDGVALDGSGNLFVSDALAVSVRKVVGNSPGDDPVGVLGSPGIAVDGSGNLFIADQPRGTVLQGRAGYPREHDPGGAVATPGVPTAWVSTRASMRRTVWRWTGWATSSSRIRKQLDLAGDLATSQVTTPVTAFLADCIAADGKGNVYYPDWGAIKSWNGPPARSRSWPVSSARTAAKMARGCRAGQHAQGNGDGWQRQSLHRRHLSARRLRSWSWPPARSPPSQATQGRRAARMALALMPASTNPFGLALDDAGNLYVADYWNSTVRKMVTLRVP